MIIVLFLDRLLSVAQHVQWVACSLQYVYKHSDKGTICSKKYKALTDFLKWQELPCHDNKYEYFRITQWWQIKEVFSLGRLSFHFLYDDILLFFFVVHQIHRAKRSTSKLFFYTYISPLEMRKINRRFSFFHKTRKKPPSSRDNYNANFVECWCESLMRSKVTRPFPSPVAK